ncbi:MAG TPA: hypothetical protein VN519_02990 [Bryobacteraceae bacterium]|nr:hypothetical protein [Bryobacteraceae bacterium]
MIMTTLGRVDVPTPGTPVPLATDPAITASKLFVQSVPGLTGKTYLGTRTMSKTTLAGVARVLSPGDSFFLESQDGADTIRLKDYAIDADVAGEGLLVSCWTE